MMTDDKDGGAAFPGLPNLEHAKTRGWKWQLNWIDQHGRPCFIRRGDSGKEFLEREADAFRAAGLPVEIIAIPEPTLSARKEQT